MSEYKFPETYWEKRCMINENVLDKIITVLGTHLPSTQDDLTNLSNSWQDALDEITYE